MSLRDDPQGNPGSENCNFSVSEQFYITTMRYSALALAALLFVSVGTSGIAQQAEEGSAPKSPPEKEGRWRERLLESLPPEMRERFEAAREKAMQDPKLRELRRTAEKAKRDFFKAMRTKMMEIDPALADMVRKRVMERKARRAWKDDEGTPGFDSLNRDEREKLLAALERAQDDPTVQAAKEKKWDAITTAERTVARDVYRKAIQEAMIKVDPSLAPILEKLNAKAAQAPSPAKPDESNPTAKEPKSQ